MLTILRTNSNNNDFQKLTTLFDAFLVDIDGDEKDFFAHFNQIYLDNAIVCFENNTAIGCGAFKKHPNNTVELKRMFVHPNHRQKGVANRILSELENWAMELNTTTILLETALKLEAAIIMYHKSGYFQIDNYDQYIGVESSYCMKKTV